MAFVKYIEDGDGGDGGSEDTAPSISRQIRDPEKSAVTIADLTPDPVNARKHTERGVAMIKDALQDVGAARSIVIDEDNRVLAGNATLEAAALAGIHNVLVVDADGETIIAVRRTGLAEDQKRRLALFDNRAGELSEFDPAVIAQFADDGLKLDDLFIDQELADITGAAASIPDFGPAGVDAQGKLDERTPVTCPACGHTWEPPLK